MAQFTKKPTGRIAPAPPFARPAAIAEVVVSYPVPAAAFLEPPAPAQAMPAPPAAPAQAPSAAGATAMHAVATAQENVRVAAERGVEQSRAAYERVKTSAESANASLESSFATAAKGINEINAKAFEALRANSVAAFDLFKALAGVKSVNEAVALHSEHARRQMEALGAQTKEIAALAQKLAADSSEPLKAGFAKAFAR